MADDTVNQELMQALKNGELEEVKLLVEKGADVNFTDSSGNHPLFWAVITDNFEMSKLLIDSGADVNALNSVNEDNYAVPAIMMVPRNNNIEIMELLIDSGADVKKLIKRD